MGMSNVHPMIEPDAEQMRRHVAHLFGGPLGECREGRIELAWTDGRDGRLRHAAIFTPDAIDALVERALTENRKPGQNVYIGQALRQPHVAPFGRCRDDEFLALTAFYVDIDDDVTATASINYRNRGCPPTGVVITGRHPHLRAQMLWRLDAPLLSPAECRHQNVALALALEGDPTVVNPSRVLRLGGSIAWPVKDGRIIERTEFLSFSDGRPDAYSAAQIAKAFPATQPSLAPTPPLDAEAVPRIHPAASTAAHTSRPTQGNLARPTADTAPLKIGSSPLSVDLCIAQIRAGDHWHDNMLRLIGHWVARGWSDGEIITAAEALTLPGYTAEQTRREVAAMITGGRRKWGIPAPEPKILETMPSAELEPGFLDSLNLAMLPRRRWLLGRSLLRGHLTLLVAPPGVGKSTHGIARAVALAAGQDITGETVHESVRTWIYNTEDDLDELKRRLGALLQHWSIPFSKIRGRLALNSGADRPLLFARCQQGDMVQRLPDVDACIARIKENDIGLLVVDPFVETHEVNENSNEQIKAVAAMFREVARAANCAVLLVHHTAKPPQGMSDGHAGNMNTARGASALVGVARVVQTLFGMSEGDAEKLGVAPDEKHLYLRLDDAKANLGLISPDANWYRKTSIELANGDEVGVLAPHIFTPAHDSFSTHQAVEILTLIDQHWRDATPFSASVQSPRYIIPTMVQSFGLSAKSARRLLRDWLSNGMVTSEIYNSDSKARGLKVLRWPG